MRIAIDGMHCEACVQRVRKAIEKVEGAQIQQVDVGFAVVVSDSSRESAILEAVHKAGYEARKSE